MLPASYNWSQKTKGVSDFCLGILIKTFLIQIVNLKFPFWRASGYDCINSFTFYSFRKHLINPFYVCTKCCVLVVGYTSNKERWPSPPGAYSSLCGISKYIYVLCIYIHMFDCGKAMRDMNNTVIENHGLEGGMHISISLFQRKSFWRGKF